MGQHLLTRILKNLNFCGRLEQNPVDVVAADTFRVQSRLGEGQNQGNCQHRRGKKSIYDVSASVRGSERS